MALCSWRPYGVGLCGVALLHHEAAAFSGEVGHRVLEDKRADDFSVLGICPLQITDRKQFSVPSVYYKEQVRMSPWAESSNINNNF